MPLPSTMQTGPLGSTIHILHADVGTICEAVEEVRSSPSSTERLEAVAWIVRRQRQASVRVREEATAYLAHRGERVHHG